jgi:hypothetical protein
VYDVVPANAFATAAETFTVLPGQTDILAEGVIATEGA